MTDNNAPAPDSATPPRQNGEKKPVQLDGVVDELRSVLSGLNRAAPAAPLSGGAEAPSAPHPAPTNGSAEVFREPAPITESDPFAKPFSTEPVSSDADFWNGNVLGWPNAPEPDFPDPNGSPFGNESLGAPFGVPDTPDNDVLRDRDGLAPFGTPEPLPGGMADPFDTPFGETDAPSPLSQAFESRNAMSFETAPAAMPAPPEPEPSGPPTPPWPVEGPGDLSSLIPEAPRSPLEEPPPITDEPESLEREIASRPAPATAPAPTEEPEVPAIERNVFSGFSGEIFAGPDLSPAAIDRPLDAPTGIPDVVVPIPKTIHKKPAPAAESEHLDLESTAMKPTGFIQIACIYPEGQEKLGQQFVTRLREAGEKAKKPVTIQAAFVQSFAPNDLDVPAWFRAASLSGADWVFVLAPKRTPEMQTALARDGAALKNRVILLDHVTLRTLYADILVELQRRKES